MALERGMITPFCEDQVGLGVVSYGLSSYGYDIRVTNELKFLPILIPRLSTPNILMMRMLLTLSVTFALSPNSFALARTVEYF